MSTGTGVNVSKANTYAVLEKPAGANVSKANTYTVLEKPEGINVSKVCVYVVLVPVSSNPPVWPDFTFGNGVVSSQYSQQFDLSPSASPISYSLEEGELPPGLDLVDLGSTIGKISGTPSNGGTSNFKLRATNSYGSAVSQQFSITNIVPSGIPEIITSSLPQALTNVPYSVTLQVQGGTGPFTFTVTEGKLPLGLTLDSLQGTIIGKPAIAGTSNFTISVTGVGDNTGSSNLSITVVNSNLPNNPTNPPSNATYPIQALDPSYYEGKLTSEYFPAIKFHQWLATVINIATDITNCLQTITNSFDLDLAVGDQLDVIGVLVGVSRTVPFQPSGGVSPVLDDDTYRLLIKATIGNNQWDGTIGGLYPLWSQLFSNGIIIINDNQNMTATILLGTFSSIVQDLITNGMIIPRPQAVAYNYEFVTLPMFGFDLETSNIAGFDQGNWV